MRITSFRVGLTLLVLFIFMVGGIVYSLFGPAPPITVSKQTTFLIEPLGADGLPDYGLALLDRQREGVTRENNGAIPFWQAMWPGELSPEEYYPLLRELGISEPDVGLREPSGDEKVRRELMYLLLKKHGHEVLAEEFRQQATADVSEQDFADLDGESPVERYEVDVERMLHVIGQPWTAAQIPPLAEWLKENERLLDLLVEAGNRPKFYSPSPTLIDAKDDPLIGTLLPAAQSIRSATRLLSTRALFRIASREYDEAWRDLLACYGLADHYSSQDWLIQELVGISCKRIADEATLHMLDQPDLPDELAKQILREFQARKPRNAIADLIDRGERLGYLDQVIRFSRGEPCDWVGSGVLNNLGVLNVDADVMLGDGNQWYDRIVEAGRLETWDERQAALRKIENDAVALRPSLTKIATAIFSRESRSRRLGELLMSLMLSTSSAAFAAEDRDNTQLDLMRLAAALAVYRTENGDYPDALVPAVLEKLPVDLFHQKPFVYKKTWNGYLIYSLGPNGQDEGGSTEGWQRYKGYELYEENAHVIRALLRESPHAEQGNKNESDENPEHEDDIDSYPDYIALENLIPAGADDLSLRLPRPQFPLPVLKE